MSITPAIPIAVVILISYLLGSIPTSIIVGRLAKGIDPRKHGSGNAGATNAFRVLGTPAGIVVIIVDVGKAVVATLLVSRLGPADIMSAETYSLIAGSSAVIGHVWTLFARFRGGKGVAPAAGMLLALYPLAFLAALAVFLCAIMLTGIVSVGSIAVAIFFPLLIRVLNLTGVSEYSMLLRFVSLGVGLLILFTHRSNIKRLARREENRFPKLMLLRSKAARRRAREATGPIADRTAADRHDLCRDRRDSPGPGDGLPKPGNPTACEDQ